MIGTRGSWGRRIGLAALVTAVALGVSASWTIAVDHVAAADRPYVGGSTNDTVGDLIFGYNGLNRIEGQGGGGPGGGPAGGRFPGGGGGGPAGPGGFAGAGGIFGGQPGATRLLSDAIGGQIAWFRPMAIVGGVAALWAERRRRQRLAGVVLWAGWLALYGVIFSEAKGTFHAYYTSAMAPAVAALVGIGGVALVRAALHGRRRELAMAVLVGTFLVTLWLQLVLIGRAPDFYGWLRPLVVAGVAAAVAGLALAAWRGSVAGRRLAAGALATGFAALCLGPAAWAASEAANAPTNATLPQAGPRGGISGSTFGSAAFDPDAELAGFLRTERGGETWDLVTANAQVASGYLAEEDLSVMALGGFMGTDSASTPAEFARQVADGKVRFVLGSRGFGGLGGPAGRPTNRQPGGTRGPQGGFGGPGGAGFGGTASSIISLAEQVCRPVTSASTNGALPANLDGALYDCAGQGPALLAASGAA